MADELDPAKVTTTIDATLQDFSNQVFLTARAAGQAIINTPGDDDPSFTNYAAWLADLTASIRSNTDISQDPGFQKLASAAHSELSPYFTPTRDTDLEQAELDPQYLALYSDQLLEIFIDQSALIRAAAADYLTKKYSILPPG
jgi:hypothetical protein